MDAVINAAGAGGGVRRGRLIGLLMAVLLPVLLTGCAGSRDAASIEAGPPEKAEWIRWRAQRLESVAGTNGWASLVGLHWLPEGSSTSGTRPGFDHVFPEGRAPEVVGLWHRSGSRVRLEPAPGVAVLMNGRPFAGESLATDADGAQAGQVQARFGSP